MLYQIYYCVNVYSFYGLGALVHDIQKERVIENINFKSVWNKFEIDKYNVHMCIFVKRGFLYLWILLLINDKLFT